MSGGALALALVVAVAAAACNASSVALQAFEARQEPKRGGPSLALLENLAHHPRWLLGTALLVVAWPLQILALGLGSITVVQPMLSTGLLMLVAISVTKLGERVGWREGLGVTLIVVGLAVLVATAPRNALHNPSVGRVLPPLIGLAVLALIAHLAGRWHPALTLVVVLGAGVGYACADFASKLVAGNASSGAWGAAAAWLAGSVLVGAIGFLGENFSLQRRPAVGVAPIIAAVKVPLPVVLALWVGGESWGPLGGGVILLCLASVTAGAVVLSSSQAVSALTAGQDQGKDKSKGDGEATPGRGDGEDDRDGDRETDHGAPVEDGRRSRAASTGSLPDRSSSGAAGS